MNSKSIFLLTSLLFFLSNCTQQNEASDTPEIADQSIVDPPKAKSKIPIFLDTDANNELDDQHAMAYLFFNKDIFNVRGVTVNATDNGGNVMKHLEEAKRVMQLCNVYTSTPVVRGANGDYADIIDDINDFSFDGQLGVDFMIAESRLKRDQRLVILAIGKLTNVALALDKAPDIAEKVRIVWLGSNYPEQGEYNQDNDEVALNYILSQPVPFEIVTVRYGKPNGSDVVSATPEEIKENLAGQGVRVNDVIGRHGGVFNFFGDYAVNLFRNVQLHGDPPARALFDMVAVAILKNPSWGQKKVIPAPILEKSKWKEQPNNERTISIWENFNKEAILDDFYFVLSQ